LDIYERSGTTTTRISAAASAGNGAFAPTFGGISADGARAFFATDEQLLQTDADSVADVYAAGPAVTAGYPRPVGATPLRVSLVPAYEECTAPNTTHAAPFAFDSCNPPVPVSDFLTVGTPDANGQGAKSTGFVKVAAVVGVPGGADDADARIEVRITDVRNQGDLSDYTGELQVTSLLRLTDKANGPAQTTPATVPDFPLVATVPCSATGDTTIGAACVLNTTLDTLVPGAVKEGKRAIYRLNDVQVFDGGPDGDVDTGAGNTLFAWQGFFVP
jgi:hypothetical protein